MLKHCKCGSRSSSSNRLHSSSSGSRHAAHMHSGVLPSHSRQVVNMQQLHTVLLPQLKQQLPSNTICAASLSQHSRCSLQQLRLQLLSNSVHLHNRHSSSSSSAVRRRHIAAAAAGPYGGSSSSSSGPGMPLPPGVTPANLQNLQNINPADIDPNGLAGLFMAYAMQLQQAAEAQQAADNNGGGQPGGNVMAKNLSFHPPGAEKPLLDNVSFNLKPNQLGLIIGRSGSGKTTLLQLLAGLSEQTSGQIFIHRPTAGDHASGLFVPTHIEERMQQVGLVFQFPERHFLGDDVMAEMTFTWPRDINYWGQRQAMAVRMQRVVDAVGLSGIPFNISPSALSGGQQRRLALALQLVRGPSVLLLDEPLAGLDWHARREVVALLRELKREATLLVVSHDLADIAPLVDCAWRMEMGGRMEPVQWPPDSLSDVED